MKVNGLNPGQAEARLDRFVDRNCICRTCAHAVAVSSPTGLECRHPELDRVLPVAGSDRCECHEFDEKHASSATRMEHLLDDWYHSIDWDAVAADCDREHSMPRSPDALVLLVGPLSLCGEKPEVPE